MANIIPLDSSPDQSITCTVPVNGKNVILDIRCRYNTEGNFWSMSVSDSVSGKKFLESIPLVCGVDILGQYQHLEIGSCFLIKTGNTSLDMPDDKTLGSDFVLVWGDRVD